jgi:hypothetical protein
MIQAAACGNLIRGRSLCLWECTGEEALSPIM